MNTFILGDIHGDFDTLKDWVSDFSQSGDTIICVGDFGAGFISYYDLFELNECCRDRKVTIKTIRGNHDNPAYFNGNSDLSNIQFIPDWTTQEINGKKFLFIGGAVSVDRNTRIKDFDWWEGEKVVDTDLTFEGIEVLITHTCPNFLRPVCPKHSNIQHWLNQDSKLKKDLIYERELMTKIWNQLQNNNITHYFYGHFHVAHYEVINDTKFRCLNINEIVSI